MPTNTLSAPSASSLYVPVDRFIPLSIHPLRPAMSSAPTLETLDRSIRTLQFASETGNPLTPEEQALLTPCLQALFGHADLPVTAPHARHANQVQTTHTLTLDQLNQQPAETRQATLKTLGRVLKIIEGAARYQPTQITLEGKPLSVHNPEFMHWIKPAYTLADLHGLNALLTQHGVFALRTDPQTGLVETADSDGSAVMHEHRWQTDNMLCGFLQRDLDLVGWRKNLVTQAAFLAHPHVQQAFHNTVQNPDWYREGGDKNGVPHLFIPHTLTFNPQTGLPEAESITLGHSWFSNQRLESQALVLLAMSKAVQNGLWKDQPNDPALLTLIAPGIAHLAQYLIAVNTHPSTSDPSKRFDFAAPSISSWEEAPYHGGMTWDTAATVLAFQALKPLLFDPLLGERADIQAVRQQVQLAANTLDPHTRLFDPMVLNQFMAGGYQQVLDRIVTPLRQGQLPMQHPNRPMDLSLAFVVSRAYPLDPNPVENARLHLQLIAALDQHLGRGNGRENGLIRYPAHRVMDSGKSYIPDYTLVDSYLASDFWMPDEYRKALNPGYHASTSLGEAKDRLIQDMLERQAVMQPGSEAEWCLGPSAILQGLGYLRQAILHPVVAEGRNSTPDEQAMLHTLKEKTDHWLARNLSLISANATRSNGSPCPPWRVMEAYEKVTIPAGLAVPNAGQTVAVPGAHTLAWGQAQLYDGLKQAIVAEKMEQTCKKD